MADPPLGGGGRGGDFVGTWDLDEHGQRVLSGIGGENAADIVHFVIFLRLGNQRGGDTGEPNPSSGGKTAPCFWSICPHGLRLRGHLRLSPDPPEQRCRLCHDPDLPACHFWRAASSPSLFSH